MRIGPLLIGVGVVVDGSKVLLARRKSQVKQWDGKWEVPGGKVKFGESIEQAVGRELREELGIEVEAIEKLGEFFENVWRLKEGQIHVVLIGYKCRIRSGKPRVRDRDSISQVKWFGLDEVEGLARKGMCLPGTLELVRAAFSGGG
jgi:8-oxo-dGTP diphosphatase